MKKNLFYFFSTANKSSLRLATEAWLEKHSLLHRIYNTKGQIQDCTADAEKTPRLNGDNVDNTVIISENLLWYLLETWKPTLCYFYHHLHLFWASFASPVKEALPRTHQGQPDSHQPQGRGWCSWTPEDVGPSIQHDQTSQGLCWNQIPTKAFPAISPVDKLACMGAGTTLASRTAEGCKGLGWGEKQAEV